MSGSCQNALPSFQGCIRTRETSPLFFQVKFSSHSSLWNGSNLSHLFLGLSSDVVIPIAFDSYRHEGKKIKLSRSTFNLVILKKYSTFKFGSGVVVNLFKVPTGFT